MSINLKDIILIKQGDSSILASPLDHAYIELYNKSKSVIHVLRCEILASSKGPVLDVISVDRLLKPSKEGFKYQEEACTARVRVDFRTSSPHVIWVFEYDNIQYHVKASFDIEGNNFEICNHVQ